MKRPLANPPFDPQIAPLLPALEGYVPVGMTPDRLAHFRAPPTAPAAPQPLGVASTGRAAGSRCSPKRAQKFEMATPHHLPPA